MKPIYKYALLTIIFLTIIVLVVKIKFLPPPPPPSPTPTTTVKKDEMILFYDNKPSEDSLNNLRNSLAIKLNVKLGEVELIPCKCDAGLIKIIAPGLTYEILGEQGPQVRTGPGSAGSNGNDDKLFGNIISKTKPIVEANIEVHEPANEKNENGSLKLAQISKSNSLNKQIVAVLDGGVKDFETLQSPIFWKNDNQENNYYGYDFTSENKLTMFKPIAINGHTHGQNVVSVLTTELNKLPHKDYKIMMLKVLKSNGKGEMFDLLCAILFAYQNEADILNLSLGYYGNKSNLLEKFINGKSLNRKTLTNKDFSQKWFVVAAGNTDSFADAMEGTSINFRNLDLRKNKFYPACYSDTSSNLLSITSLGEIEKIIQPSINTNFSNKYVDYGVLCDRKVSGKFEFEINGRDASGSNSSFFIEGSSFATPVFTAQLTKLLDSSPTKMRMLLLNKENYASGRSLTRNNIYIKRAP